MLTMLDRLMMRHAPKRWRLTPKTSAKAWEELLAQDHPVEVNRVNPEEK